MRCRYRVHQAFELLLRACSMRRFEHSVLLGEHDRETTAFSYGFGVDQRIDYVRCSRFDLMALCAIRQLFAIYQQCDAICPSKLKKLVCVRELVSRRQIVFARSVADKQRSHIAGSLGEVEMKECGVYAAAGPLGMRRRSA